MKTTLNNKLKNEIEKAKPSLQQIDQMEIALVQDIKANKVMTYNHRVLVEQNGIPYYATFLGSPKKSNFVICLKVGDKEYDRSKRNSLKREAKRMGQYQLFKNNEKYFIDKTQPCFEKTIVDNFDRNKKQ